MAKSVLITGTSTGIGRACVERLAAEGWRVYAGVRKDADADAIQRDVRGDVRPLILDVTDVGQIADAIARVRDDLGPAGLDGLVNNAGVSEGGPIETVSDAAWQWHFEVNVFGVIRLTRAALPLLRDARGRVVNIGSIAGRAAAPMLAPYSAGKHAVEAISESLRFEVADQGIKVACVEPGEIASEIWAKAKAQIAEVEAGFDPDQAARYSRGIDMMYGFLADGMKRGVPASKVADVVHHALASPHPKHRYLIGPNARLVGLAKYLPDRLRAPALGVNIGMWERAGRKLRRG